MSVQNFFHQIIKIFRTRTFILIKSLAGIYNHRSQFIIIMLFIISNSTTYRSINVNGRY